MLCASLCASIWVEVRRMKTKRPYVAGLFLATLLLALIVASAQPAGAKPQLGKVKQTAMSVTALAMDGPRVAYMLASRRVGVWNVVTGATSVVKGDYPSKGRNFGYGTGEVAIAGKQVALITRFEIGNTLQTQERLYTASLGGSARQLGKLTNHSSDGGDCTVPGSGYADGNWLGGLVGSAKALAVSSWKANDATTSGERLSLIRPTGLRTIATGPGAIVSQSADRGHIAVLRSTDAWPAYQGPAQQGTPLVGVYSTAGTLVREIAFDVPLPNPCGDPSTHIRIALSGNQLVVLRLDVPQAGSLTATVEVYDWTTDALVHTWPLALSHVGPIADRLSVSGRIAIVQGAFRLRMLDLATGQETTVAASRPNSPAIIGSRGLVYALNRIKESRPGKLVFVPTAKLLAALSK
jgi:hypothetical protein